MSSKYDISLIKKYIKEPIYDWNPQNFETFFTKVIGFKNLEKLEKIKSITGKQYLSEDFLKNENELMKAIFIQLKNWREAILNNKEELNIESTKSRDKTESIPTIKKKNNDKESNSSSDKKEVSKKNNEINSDSDNVKSSGPKKKKNDSETKFTLKKKVNENNSNDESSSDDSDPKSIPTKKKSNYVQKEQVEEKKISKKTKTKYDNDDDSSSSSNEKNQNKENDKLKLDYIDNKNKKNGNQDKNEEIQFNENSKKLKKIDENDKVEESITLFKNNENPNKIKKINSFPFKIGSNTNCDYLIANDKNISLEHAQIIKKNSGFYLENLNKNNNSLTLITVDNYKGLEISQNTNLLINYNKYTYNLEIKPKEKNEYKFISELDDGSKNKVKFTMKSTNPQPIYFQNKTLKLQVENEINDKKIEFDKSKSGNLFLLPFESSDLKIWINLKGNIMNFELKEGSSFRLGKSSTFIFRSVICSFEGCKNEPLNLLCKHLIYCEYHSEIIKFKSFNNERIICKKCDN